MYDYGKTSKARLETVDPRLQLVFRAALAQGLMDISIIQGVRPQEEQDLFYKEGKSKVQWPNGKHNVKEPGEKSKAVDAAPFINGKISYDHRHCCYLAGLIQGIGRSLGINIRWGGNWDQDGEPVTDQDFQDLVHFEIVEG
jgi:peptidoglycan L-alanyl-D-glutamate endopeptidase CwlK